MSVTTTTSLQRFVLTRLGLSDKIALEFYDRLLNLCEYSGTPMTPALHEWVLRRFGLKMCRVIENFADYDAPRLMKELYEPINRIIAPDVRDEFIGLFSISCIPPGDLAFTYEMDRNLATNDTVRMAIEFTTSNQTGYIDWGDGSPLEAYDSGAGTSLSLAHLFTNGGLNDIKFYAVSPSRLFLVLINGDGGVGTTGGIGVVFEPEVTSLAGVIGVNSSISVFPTTIPTSVTGLSFENNLLTTVDLTGYSNLLQLSIDNNALTSINLTGVVNLDTLNLSDNPGLSSLTIPAYTNLLSLYIHSCAFSTASIEGFLDGLDSNGLLNGFCEAQNQTPAAPVNPAYPAYDSLVIKNWLINTDV